MNLTRHIQIICLALVLETAFAFSSPQQSLALSFEITSSKYSISADTDRPGYPPSPATQDGSRVDSVSGAHYSLQATSSAAGQITATPFTMGRGAGGYHTEFWDISLKLVGEYGEAADLYINSEVSGSADLWAFDACTAFVRNTSQLAIYNAGGTELHQYYYTWRQDAFFDIKIDEEFEDIIDSLYLGTMIVGDPEWGSIRILGNHDATAYAQAHAFVLGISICGIVSGFKFDITARPHFEPTPGPIPEPTTVLLLGLGLVGLAGVRRKLK